MSSSPGANATTKPNGQASSVEASNPLPVLVSLNSDSKVASAAAGVGGANWVRQASSARPPIPPKAPSALSPTHALPLTSSPAGSSAPGNGVMGVSSPPSTTVGGGSVGAGLVPLEALTDRFAQWNANVAAVPVRRWSAERAVGSSSGVEAGNGTFASASSAMASASASAGSAASSASQSYFSHALSGAAAPAPAPAPAAAAAAAVAAGGGGGVEGYAVGAAGAVPRRRSLLQVVPPPLLESLHDVTNQG
jgi:hypothetical protein